MVRLHETKRLVEQSFHSLRLDALLSTRGTAAAGIAGDNPFHTARKNINCPAALVRRRFVVERFLPPTPTQPSR